MRRNPENTDAGSAWAGNICAMGTCTKVTCFEGVCTKGAFVGFACVGGVFVGLASIGSIGTVKRLRIQSQ